MFYLFLIFNILMRMPKIEFVFASETPTSPIARHFERGNGSLQQGSNSIHRSIVIDLTADSDVSWAILIVRLMISHFLTCLSDWASWCAQRSAKTKFCDCSIHRYCRSSFEQFGMNWVVPDKWPGIFIIYFSIINISNIIFLAWLGSYWWQAANIPWRSRYLE